MTTPHPKQKEKKSTPTPPSPPTKRLGGPDCEFHGIINFRDLGDIENNPQIVNKSKIYRCGLLCILDSDLKVLQEKYKIKTIIDLRAKEEVTEQGQHINGRSCPPLPERAHQFNIEYHNIPLIPIFSFYFQAFWRASSKDKLEILQRFLTFKKKESIIKLREAGLQNGLGFLNRLIVKEGGNQVSQVFNLLSDSNNFPLVICCSLGKDRTGLISALILQALELDQSDIINDYLKSEEVISACWDYVKEQFLLWNIVPNDRMRSAPPDVILSTIDYIIAHYGTIIDYLRKHGFDETCHHKFKDILLIRPEFLNKTCKQ